MAQHLALVALLVPDYDTGIAYFTQKLGFDLLEDTDIGGGKRWVRVAPQGAQTAFLLAEAKGEQRDVIGQQGGGRVWLFLHTDSFDADFARMQAAGVTFAEEPRSESYGKVAVFTDDFGNRWDLLQLKTA
ncbi:Glyoxalase/Bleomycin resistance protein/Dioxygenase superfamily protein [Pelagimonas phthalicica]|uniref:Glyoxalase/Bleomycin resistance protein/Dioxygenase superfamily protein n=1 Tax=Pelagimonas phthalicica TaxID=1037362 RepID=A0A238JE99_9RHOB|nr:VOC family protein [Pelagimonas phthalicica]TDS91961.1 catechol 2,3-dioxygenase-like lactoylglutathione lyase family enzyme [Pelagimonas phthalicica]SMX29011.1 Glyoxalase/Bleomycin resistance protein/Dioxygenase superfamily protein [Pelagimonas phthalicica]